MSLSHLPLSGDLSLLVVFPLLHYQGPLQQTEKFLLYSSKKSRQSKHTYCVKYTGKLIHVFNVADAQLKKKDKGGRKERKVSSWEGIVRDKQKFSYSGVL